MFLVVREPNNVNYVLKVAEMENIEAIKKSRDGVPNNSIKNEDDEEDDEDMVCAGGEWDMMHETDLMWDSDYEEEIEDFPPPAGSTTSTDLPMHKYPFKLKQDGLG